MGGLVDASRKMYERPRNVDVVVTVSNQLDQCVACEPIGSPTLPHDVLSMVASKTDDARSLASLSLADRAAHAAASPELLAKKRDSCKWRRRMEGVSFLNLHGSELSVQDVVAIAEVCDRRLNSGGQHLTLLVLTSGVRPSARTDTQGQFDFDQTHFEQVRHRRRRRHCAGRGLESKPGADLAGLEQ
jgi:hypothetical protein